MLTAILICKVVALSVGTSLFTIALVDIIKEVLDMAE